MQLLEQVFTRYVQRSREEAKSRLHDKHTGQLLVDVLQSSPHQESDIKPARNIEMPVRAVDL